MLRRSFCRLLGASTLRAAPAPSRPNVVLILTDDMGYADIEPFGSRQIRTPYLTRLAREGVRFTNAYANGPVCTPTRAALMTGRYQQRVGLEWAIRPGDKAPGLPASPATLPRLLKDAGYATAMYGKWHLGYRPECGPNAHGFDQFFGILSGNVDYYSHIEESGEYDLHENGQTVRREGYLTDLLADGAARWVGQHARQPFFLYLAFNAPHYPFQPPHRPDSVRTKETWYGGTRADYAQMVESIDTGVGRVLDTVRRSGVAENTLVIFTNDNGGDRLMDNGPLFHRKGTLWEGGIRVPALMRWPQGRLRRGDFVAPVISMDWTATIAAACGAAPAAGYPFDGANLLPALRGEVPLAERALCWRVERPGRGQRAVRMGKWKYLSDGGTELLFDLNADPSERRDVALANTDVTVRLREAGRSWRLDVDRVPPPFVVR